MRLFISKVAREDPCEVCLCVDGEIFCWWKKCGNLKRRKFKLEKSARLAKQIKGKTIDRIHKDQQQQQQLHSKQRKKLDYKLKQKQQQHWQEQHIHHHQQHQPVQHPAVRNKILTFPENLPSVLYYDYKTEDQQQHQVHHGNHEKLSSSSLVPMGDAHTSANAFVLGKSSRRDENDDDVDEEKNDVVANDDAASSSSAVGVAEATSAKSHLAAETSDSKNSVQQTSTAKITTTTIAAALASRPFFNENPQEDQSSTEVQYISGHPPGDLGQMLNMDSTRHPKQLVRCNHTTTIQGDTISFLSQSQEVDHDGILRDGPNDGGSPIIYPSTSSSSSSSLLNLNSIKQNNEQQRGVGATSFRSSFNDFSSEFNASAALDLALIISHHSTQNAPIILEADSIANASSSSSSSSSLPKHEVGGPQGTPSTNSSVLNTTEVAPSTTVNPAQECIVMGASYKIGAILPQDTGNCLQCVCKEGNIEDDTPRVTCSPHNCPPLVLPDLFDATGY